MRRTTAFSGPFLALPLWAVDQMLTSGEHQHLPVLTALVALCDVHDHTCQKTVGEIAMRAAVSERTAQRSLRWLSDNGVVSVSKDSGRAVPVYKVHYSDVTKVTPRVTAVTPLRVTRMSPLPRRIMKSRVTPVSPSNTPQTLIPQGNPEFPIEVWASTTVVGTKEVGGIGTYGPCASAPEATMILGADPHEERPAPPAKKPSDVNALVSHFVNHPQVVMSRSYPSSEVAMLRKSMKLLLAGGLDRKTIISMIDKFYSTDRFRESERAAFLFSNKKLQSELLASIGGVVATDDPLLELMLTDFVRETVDLPWSAVYDADLRKAVVSRGLDACFRYPELVASLAYAFPGDFRNDTFISALTALNDLVIATALNDKTAKHLVDSIPIDLPKELRTINSKALREQAGTIAEAVYRYQRGSNVLR